MASSLWDSSLFLEANFQNGHYYLPAPAWDGIQEFAVQCAVPGFAPKVLRLPPNPGEMKVELDPIAPITIQVRSPSGAKLPNAQCWLRSGNPMKSSAKSDWVYSLQEVGFGNSVFTDDKGVASFSICYPGAFNTIQVYPESEFAGATMEGLSPGDEQTLICFEACTIRGRLLNRNTNAPIPGSVTISTLDSNFDMTSVLTYEVGQDGVFRAERLPAGFPVLFLEAHSPGFSHGEGQVVSALPSSNTVLDIYLDEAASLDLTLETTWGAPIPNTEVTLRRRRHGWQSPALFTDSSGQVHFPAILPKDEELAVILGIEGSFWLRAPRNLKTGERVLVVDGLARIQNVRVHGIPSSDEPAHYSWSAIADEYPGDVHWISGEPSPLLPAGPGHLRVTTRKDVSFQQHLVLMDGELEELGIEFQPAPFKFTWAGSGQALLTITDASANSVVDSLEITPGAHQIDLWQGSFQVAFSHEGGTRTWNRLTIPIGGLDLGAVTEIDDSGVWGMIKSSNDLPVTGLLINLVELGGLGKYFGGTDEQGQFVFNGVPPGEYRLSVAGGITRGGAVPDVDTTLLLGPGEWLGPVKIVVDTKALGFTGRVAPNPITGSSAWMLLQGQMQHQDLPMSHEFLFPIPTSETWFGVSHLGKGSLQVSGQRIATGETNGVVTWNPDIRNIRFVDELGLPRTDLFLHAYLNGVALPFQATPNAQGSINLSATPGLPLTIQVKTSDGLTRVWEVGSLLQKEKITLPNNTNHSVVVVMDENRSPLPLAAAIRSSIGDVIQANARGEILLPQFDSKYPFRISAPGYLGAWLYDDQSRELALRPLVYNLTLDLGDGSSEDSMPFEDAEAVLLTFDDLPPFAAFDSPLRVPLQKGRKTSLPPLPSGSVTAVLIKGNGDSISAKTFAISKSDQRLYWED